MAVRNRRQEAIKLTQTGRPLRGRPRQKTGSKFLYATTNYAPTVDRVAHYTAIEMGSGGSSSARSSPVLNVEMVSELQFGDRRFRLKSPMILVSMEQDGTWGHAIHDLRLTGYGLTESESRDALAFDLTAIWDGLVNEDPENLTADALDLRNLLLASVEEKS